MTDTYSPAAPLSGEALAAAVSGSSFYAGMRVLPKAEREAMFAIYGFCRLVDDIADDQTAPRPERGAMLARWRHDIAALYHGGDAGPEAYGQASFLAEAVRRFSLVEADFIAVIDGMQMDVDADIRWPDYATLDLYCDRVASAVGRLSVNVFGMERSEGVALAHHLGRALQLTNILRDIDEDAGIGRVYLPSSALIHAGLWPAGGEAGITPTTIEALVADPRLDAAARWLAGHAEAHFREAAAILGRKPKGLLVAPRLMEVAYSRLLRRMVKQGWAPPRTRVKSSKFLLALAALRFWLLG